MRDFTVPFRQRRMIMVVNQDLLSAFNVKLFITKSVTNIQARTPPAEDTIRSLTPHLLLTKLFSHAFRMYFVKENILVGHIETELFDLPVMIGHKLKCSKIEPSMGLVPIDAVRIVLPV